MLGIVCIRREKQRLFDGNAAPRTAVGATIAKGSECSGSNGEIRTKRVKLS